MKTQIMLLVCLLAGSMAVWASDETISLKFNRTGTDAQSVTVSVADATGATIQGASATLTASHSLKGTGNAVTQAIVCPNVNANTSPSIILTLTVNGLPAGFSFNRIGLDIHALNGGSNYQENADGVTRQWNVTASTGSESSALETFGHLTDIDIAAGVGSGGAVHQVWSIENTQTIEASEPLVLKLTITKGTANAGCFFGLSEVQLSTVVTEPEPEPEPADSVGKIYYIQWKNTGGNHITEGSTHYLTVTGKNTGKAQFWRFIPSGRDNCYYIRNTVTGRYLGSCNLTPSSASRITTSSTPIEYYVGATAATSGEIVGCHYLSSTDCADYADESKGPRALNKDGASDYVITWQAGTSRVGSYWKLVETTDTFVKPQHSIVAKSLCVYFNPCGTIGTNYLTAARLYGEGATGHIFYEASAKPSSWHILYPHDRGVVTRGADFNLGITLADIPHTDLVAIAYADWDADGVFETTCPLTLSGKDAEASISVPEDASKGPSRLRIRINSNGLNLAEDDVEGFVYDFHLSVADPVEGRTVTLSANADGRGSVSLSEEANGTSYSYGKELTAKAIPYGNATFICWREEGVVVSTDAEYTFTVDRNVHLKAYFTANTEIDTHIAEGSITLGADELAISVQAGKIVATGNVEVISMSLYTVDAALVAYGTGNTLPCPTTKEGVYIARATTSKGYKNVKLHLNK